MLFSNRTIPSEHADPQDVFVRQLGHVEDRPIVRQIGERDLYLGNWHAARKEQQGRRFEFVVSATQESYPATTHHHPLIDGPEAEWSAFEAAVDTARGLYRRDGSLLIHCRAGISRSTTLVATSLAAEEDRTFREALDTVHDVRPLAMPHPALHELAVMYLAAKA